jgi:hypothetical protein
MIWLNHHDLVQDNSNRYTIGTNGTAVFIDSRPGITFPDEELISIFVPTLSPGLYVTGMRVCYGIVGNHPDTEVHRLRLGRFDTASGGGTFWPGYLIMLEDVSTFSAAPTPPAGGFAFGDPNGFLCVDSKPDVCLDPAKGTINASTGVRLGDADDRIVILAVGLRYDATCTPN